MFVQIGRVGRSLGVHLLLASQRLEEGRLRGLETHLSYRHRPAHVLVHGQPRGARRRPTRTSCRRAPGHGYLKTGTEGMIRFRAAYVSGVIRRGEDGIAAGRRRPTDPVRAFTTHYQALADARAEPARSRDRGAEDGGRRDAAGRARRAAWRAVALPAHQVWLPPLAEPSTLDQLLPPVTSHGPARLRRRRPGVARLAARRRRHHRQAVRAAPRADVARPGRRRRQRGRGRRPAERQDARSCVRSSPASRSTHTPARRSSSASTSAAAG